jgi:hypothetical protein
MKATIEFLLLLLLLLGEVGAIVAPTYTLSSSQQLLPSCLFIFIFNYLYNYLFIYLFIFIYINVVFIWSSILVVF